MINENEEKNEKYYGSILDRADELIESGIDRVYYDRDASFIKHLKHWGEEEPDTYSYITLDLEFPKCATDRSDVIAYRDAATMQEAFIDWIRCVVTPDMLEMVRKGEIENLTLRLGPDTLSGYNLREVL